MIRHASQVRLRSGARTVVAFEVDTQAERQARARAQLLPKRGRGGAEPELRFRIAAHAKNEALPTI